MAHKLYIKQILQDLLTLPPEKMAEVHDFILFLQTRYSKSPMVDEKDFWTEEDLAELMQAALNYAEHGIWMEEGNDAEAR